MVGRPERQLCPSAAFGLPPRRFLVFSAFTCFVVDCTVVGRRPPRRRSLAAWSAGSRGTGFAWRQHSRLGGARLCFTPSPPSFSSAFLHSLAFLVGPTAVNGRPTVSEAPCFAPRHPVPICALECLVVGSTVVGRRPPPLCSLAGRSAESRGSESARRQCTRRGGAHFWCRASSPPLPSTFLPLASFWSPRRSWTDNRLSPRRSALPHAIPSPFVRCCA